MEPHFTPADPGPGFSLNRMTTCEVMAAARISRATLWRRVACGRLPRPIDQARQSLFLRCEVDQALARDPRGEAALAVAIEQRLATMRRRFQKQS